MCEAYPTEIVVMGTDRIASRPGALGRSAAEALACQAHHNPVVVVGPSVIGAWRDGSVAVALDGFIPTHGLRGVERETPGSVTLGVVAQSPCPVRVARPRMVTADRGVTAR